MTSINQKLDWQILNNHFRCPIVPDLLKRWEQLLNENLQESKYQHFLADHANFFFPANNTFYFTTISKLKLGSEYETDFVIIYDGFSNGAIYEFVEIEKPSSKLFTASGVPASDFNSALQQIRDWKSFLRKNKQYFKTFLPTTSTQVIHDSNIKFKILIGRRCEDQSIIEKRMDVAYEEGVEIRSFDSLTDNLKNRFFYHKDILNEIPENVENTIINPFNRALSDAEWKMICKTERLNSSHIFHSNSKKVYQYLRQNDLFEKFKQLTAINL